MENINIYEERKYIPKKLYKKYSNTDNLSYYSKKILEIKRKKREKKYDKYLEDFYEDYNNNNNKYDKLTTKLYDIYNLCAKCSNQMNYKEFLNISETYSKLKEIKEKEGMTDIDFKNYLCSEEVLTNHLDIDKEVLKENQSFRWQLYRQLSRVDDLVNT